MFLYVFCSVPWTKVSCPVFEILTALVAWKGCRTRREVYTGCRCFPKAGRAFATSRRMACLPRI